MKLALCPPTARPDLAHRLAARLADAPAHSVLHLATGDLATHSPAVAAPLHRHPGAALLGPAGPSPAAIAALAAAVPADAIVLLDMTGVPEPAAPPLLAALAAAWARRPAATRALVLLAHPADAQALAQALADAFLLAPALLTEAELRARLAILQRRARLLRWFGAGATVRRLASLARALRRQPG